MKTIVLGREDSEKILEHFIAYGFTDFVVFSKAKDEYYSLNGINVVSLNGFPNEGVGETLLKIRGSLSECFIIAYSQGICEFDLDEIKKFHRAHQCVATLVTQDKMMCACVLEPEIFDYLEGIQSFEREALLKIGQAGELQIFK